MAFLRSATGDEVGLVLRAQSLWLRVPALGDFSPWSQLRALSREHLEPFEPHWQGDELTRVAFRRRIRHYQREIRGDLGYAFFIFKNENNELIGGITLSNVRRGVTQAVTLGYWVGAPYAGRGVMSEAVSAVLPFVFDTLRLHRIEAACLEHNHASIRVLEKSGFRREGLARRYLKINGDWQDHILFGLLEDDRKA